MKILFYQLDSKHEKLESWKRGVYFGHPLFGATHFPQHGIEVVMTKNPYDAFYLKIKKIIKVDPRKLFHSLGLLFTARKYDMVYAPYPAGLGLLLFFRGIGLFNKPIVIYSHPGIPRPKNMLKRFIMKRVYKGSDKVLFFSQWHLNEALKSGICDKERMFKINWGPDLEFYDRQLAQIGPGQANFFISTGKAKRDYETLVSAFEKTEAPLRLYVDTKELEEQYAGRAANIDVRFLQATSTSPGILAKSLNDAFAVTICTQKVTGLIGITNILESMALSKPIIISKNKAIDIDVEKEGIGITVDFYDAEGWRKAIEYLSDNPEIAAEMGRKGRALCEKKYNLDIFANEVINILKQ
jgi:glycosyltransferase involved in cell wall biosynthesis